MGVSARTGLSFQARKVITAPLQTAPTACRPFQFPTGSAARCCGTYPSAQTHARLNIAEGNGKTAEADRRRYFEIARGSVLECGAIQDVLVVGKALDEQESLARKTELDRMAAMLSRLGGRGYCVAENSVPYGTKPEKVDPDPGPDFDFEKEKPQQGGGGAGIPSPHR